MRTHPRFEWIDRCCDGDDGDHCRGRPGLIIVRREREKTLSVRSISCSNWIYVFDEKNNEEKEAG